MKFNIIMHWGKSPVAFSGRGAERNLTLKPSIYSKCNLSPSAKK